MSIKISTAIINAESISEVIAVINNAAGHFYDDGNGRVAFTPTQLAGQQAYRAGKESGYFEVAKWTVMNQELEGLKKAGANFDHAGALEYGMTIA